MPVHDDLIDAFADGFEDLRDAASSLVRDVTHLLVPREGGSAGHSHPRSREPSPSADRRSFDKQSGHRSSSSRNRSGSSVSSQSSPSVSRQRGRKHQPCPMPLAETTYERRQHYGCQDCQTKWYITETLSKGSWKETAIFGGRCSCGNGHRRRGDPEYPSYAEKKEHGREFVYGSRGIQGSRTVSPRST